ncbi:hypothetical protein FHETE_687 [Fusarium heterosporum]|uniref:Uncharacterized protein n=1 Tax=Fusarium heterosporum TaxID=42747 RepID=A0A8H5TZ46_FUSHE|nr:hypothetical protein FHETE_687 [Fusarium heterosporum]
MTTPPFSLKSSPRKILSESSDTHSLRSSNFAKLLSKFEVLDAVSSVSNSPYACSKANPAFAFEPPSIVGYRSPIWSSQASIKSKAKERSSTESTHYSPGHYVTPRRDSPRLSQAQTFSATALAKSESNNDTSKSRHKSVAERRRMFEAASQRESKNALIWSTEPMLINRVEAPTPFQTLVSPRATHRLAHSKSWQSIKTQRSAAKPNKDEATISQNPPNVNLNSSSKATRVAFPEVYSPRTLNASDDPPVTWRSPLNRAVHSWTPLKRSSLTMATPEISPSYTKSQYVEKSPHSEHATAKSQVKFYAVPADDLLNEKDILVDGTRYQGWVRNARKIASSLTNTVSAGSSTTLNRSRGSHNASSQDSTGNNGFVPFKFGRESTLSHSKLPRSRIASIRKKCDLSKEQASPVTALLEIPNSGSVSVKIKNPKSPYRLPLLESSDSSESEAPGTPKFRSKSYAPHRSQSSLNEPRSRSPVGRRNTEKYPSPLKQKIDLFKSLDHHDTVKDSSSSISGGRWPILELSNRKDSVIGPLRSFKGALRKLSASCRRIPSEWSTTSSRDIGASLLRSSDDSLVAQEDHVATAAVEESPPRLTIDATPMQPILSQTFLPNEISPLVLEKPLSPPRVSIARAGFNIDGEAGVSEAPPPLFAEPQRRFSHTRHALSRAANRFSLPDVEKELEIIELLDDNLRYNPVISKVRCELEQPRPVRTNQVRRLASLCKGKVRKLSGGRSE